MSAPGVGRVVALLGAESTGKTRLAQELADELVRRGHRATWVGEVLRGFCDREGRTPHRHEQVTLAQAQTQAIGQALADHDVVVADTTALMTAVYSDWVFGDDSLYAAALASHMRHPTLTLVMALDLPWQADGLQRDGPHVRAPVDATLRQALARGGVPFAVVSGQGADRLCHALSSVLHWLARGQGDALVGETPSRARWRWVCESCDDPDCERRWLPRHAPDPAGAHDELA